MVLSGASSEAACPENEPYEVCVIEAQRNNAYNDIAHIAGQQDRQEKYWKSYLVGEEAQRQWWQQYIAGIEEQLQQAARENATMTARVADRGCVR